MGKLKEIETKLDDMKKGPFKKISKTKKKGVDQLLDRSLQEASRLSFSELKYLIKNGS